MNQFGCLHVYSYIVDITCAHQPWTEMPETQNGAHYNLHSSGNESLKFTATCSGDAILDASVAKTLAIPSLHW